MNVELLLTLAVFREILLSMQGRPPHWKKKTERTWTFINCCICKVQSIHSKTELHALMLLQIVKIFFFFFQF